MMQNCAKPHKNSPEVILWNEEIKHAFRHIKYILCSAPALGLPDYKLTFHLYAADNGETASAVLGQEHGNGIRPVAFYGKMLPLIVKGMVPCLRAVASAALMVEKAQTIVLGHPMILHTSHTADFPTHRQICGGAPQNQHRPPHIAFRNHYSFNTI